MMIFWQDLQTPGQVLPCGGKPLPRRHHLDPRAGNLSKRPTRTRRWCCHRQQCAWKGFFSLQNILFNLISPFPLYWGVGSHPLASLSKQLQNLRKDTGKEHLSKCITEIGLEGLLRQFTSPTARNMSWKTRPTSVVQVMSPYPTGKGLYDKYV